MTDYKRVKGDQATLADLSERLGTQADVDIKEKSLMKTWLLEDSIAYGETTEWYRELKLLSVSPFLYLEEYENIPEDFLKWKYDQELVSPVKKEELKKYLPKGGVEKEQVPSALCVGIGKYPTQEDGEIYLCTILDKRSRRVLSYALGVCRSAELVRKALENLFSLYQKGEEKAVLLSSRNPVYCSKCYTEILNRFPVEKCLTEKGTRGGAAVVSTFFSQLMRRKAGTVFHTWQDAADWLVMYIFHYNLEREDV